jgi:hypothetical protein
MIKTKAEVITSTIGLWAIPRSPDCLEPGEFPFSYELYGTTTHWRNTAIFIASVPISAEVPEGLDLLTMAHQTLDQRAEHAREKYDNEMERIAKDRKSLYLLAAPVQGVDLGDGHELLPPETPPDELFAGMRTYGEPIDYNEEAL